MQIAASQYMLLQNINYCLRQYVYPSTAMTALDRPIYSLCDHRVCSRLFTVNALYKLLTYFLTSSGGVLHLNCVTNKFLYISQYLLYLVAYKSRTCTLYMDQAIGQFWK